MSDTHLLIAAVGMGKGLKLNMPIPNPGPNMMVPAIRPNAPMGGASPGNVPQLPKPAGIKTNIKAANQVHQFTR